LILKLNINERQVPSEPHVLAAVRDAFASLREGHAFQPPQCSIVLPDAEGDCIFYPGYVRSARAFGVKVSPYLESRKRLGLNPVTAFTLLVNAETGEPELLVDAKALTTERTAATTLIAVHALCAKREVRTVGIVGTGSIGRSHARYASHLFPGVRITMHSPTAARQDAIGENRRKIVLNECGNVGIASSIDALLECDVVMLCTSSGTPVIDVASTSSHCLITSVGTNLPNTHEIDWRALPSLHVYCDYRETCFRTAGDMRLAIEHGAWTAERIVADIPELIAGGAPQPVDGRLYFRATGLALEDIAVAKLVAP
jgi:L-arginine dehydrogenase